jgi:hypothetical protein
MRGRSTEASSTSAVIVLLSATWMGCGLFGKIPKDLGEEGAGIKACYALQKEMASTAKDVIKLGDDKETKSDLPMVAFRYSVSPAIGEMLNGVTIPVDANDVKENYFDNFEDKAGGCRMLGNSVSCLLSVTVKDPNKKKKDKDDEDDKEKKPKRLRIGGSTLCIAKNGAILPAGSLEWSATDVADGDKAYVRIDDIERCLCAGGAKLRLVEGSGAAPKPTP